MSLPIYLDYAATTPVDERVAAKMAECLTIDGAFGNPASSHVFGLVAKEAVNKAREQVAGLIGAEAGEIVWTSGATESDNLAIKGAAHFYQRKGKHIITCATEHKAVLDTCADLEREGFEVTYLKPESDGLLDLNKLESAMRDDTILVSIMQVNNEIGIIQDIDAIGKLTKPRGILFHVDAAQSAGKIEIDLKKLNIDLMSFAAHKVYGPKGMGALYVRREPRIRLMPLIHGGGHELGLRSGTLPTHQIVGMGEAFDIAKNELINESARIKKLRDTLFKALNKLDNVYLNGSLDHLAPGILNMSFEGVDGEALLLALSDIAVSSSSACVSSTIEPSYVLRALGRSDELAHSSVRFSIGRFTTEKEIERTIDHVLEQLTRLREVALGVRR